MAPLVPSFVLTIVAGNNIGYASAIQLMPVIYIVALTAAVLLALPALVLVGRFGRITWWVCLIVGVATAVMVEFAIHWPSSPNVSDFVRMAPIGAASALTFWLLWRLRERS